jgi:hypothetical protein
MKLKIVQFNWNAGGGSATIHLEGPTVESALQSYQYFSVLVGFHTRRTSDLVEHADQERVLIPGHSDRWLVVGFFTVTSVNLGAGHTKPSPSTYRPLVARLLANMAANAQLDNLNAPVPLVVPT